MNDNDMLEEVRLFLMQTSDLVNKNMEDALGWIESNHSRAQDLARFVEDINV